MGRSYITPKDYGQRRSEEGWATGRETFSAGVQEGIDWSLLRYGQQAVDRYNLSEEVENPKEVLDQDAFYYSEFFRPGMKYEEGLTRLDLAVRAEAHDRTKRSEAILNDATHDGAWLQRMGGNLAGSLLSPENFAFFGGGRLYNAAKYGVGALTGVSRFRMTAMTASLPTSRLAASMMAAAENGMVIAGTEPFIVEAMKKEGTAVQQDQQSLDLAAGVAIGAGLGFLTGGRAKARGRDMAVRGFAEAAEALDRDMVETLDVGKIRGMAEHSAEVRAGVEKAQARAKEMEAQIPVDLLPEAKTKRLSRFDQAVSRFREILSTSIEKTSGLYREATSALSGGKTARQAVDSIASVAEKTAKRLSQDIADLQMYRTNIASAVSQPSVSGVVAETGQAASVPDNFFSMMMQSMEPEAFSAQLDGFFDSIPGAMELNEQNGFIDQIKAFLKREVGERQEVLGMTGASDSVASNETRLAQIKALDEAIADRQARLAEVQDVVSSAKSAKRVFSPASRKQRVVVGKDEFGQSIIKEVEVPVTARDKAARLYAMSFFRGTNRKRGLNEVFGNKIGLFWDRKRREFLLLKKTDPFAGDSRFVMAAEKDLAEAMRRGEVAIGGDAWEHSLWDAYESRYWDSSEKSRRRYAAPGEANSPSYVFEDVQFSYNRKTKEFMVGKATSPESAFDDFYGKIERSMPGDVHILSRQDLARTLDLMYQGKLSAEVTENLGNAWRKFLDSIDADEDGYDAQRAISDLLYGDIESGVSPSASIQPRPDRLGARTMDRHKVHRSDWLLDPNRTVQDLTRGTKGEMSKDYFWSWKSDVMARLDSLDEDELLELLESVEDLIEKSTAENFANKAFPEESAAKRFIALDNYREAIEDAYQRRFTMPGEGVDFDERFDNRNVSERGAIEDDPFIRSRRSEQEQIRAAAKAQGRASNHAGPFDTSSPKTDMPGEPRGLADDADIENRLDEQAKEDVESFMDGLDEEEIVEADRLVLERIEEIENREKTFSRALSVLMECD